MSADRLGSEPIGRTATHSIERSDDCLGFETTGRAEAQRNSGIEKSVACPGSENSMAAAQGSGIARSDDCLGFENKGRTATPGD